MSDGDAAAPGVPDTDYAFLDALLADSTAEAFVHVADRFDDRMRYLTRFHGPDRDFAFVRAGGTATLCSPPLFDGQARREFAGEEVRVAGETDAETPEGVAAEVLEAAGIGRALVLDAARHRTVERLEERGLAVPTVPAGRFDAARRRKTEGEIDRQRFVQRVARRGMRRAEAVLAGSIRDGDALLWEGAPLTTERLRREVNAVLASGGITDAGNTVVGAGPSCTDLHFTGDDDIHPDGTVLLDVSPRGQHGYYGDFTRTFVPGEVREWERSAYDAVDAARGAALDALASGAGTPGGKVREAVEDALADHGFPVGDVDVGMTHGPGHGIGLSLHEAPSYDEPLAAGEVLTLEPGVYDPERGGVRLEDVVVVREEGIERFGDYPRSIEPRPA
ncbi:peptidase M24 [Halobacteriales archaeon QS_5_70_15]|nr:MAG: peptidase M24 [Halobacteriales archaeon QS_5_70_15]